MPCTFCGAAATMSGEHVWSSWIGDLFGEGPGRYTFRRYGPGELQQRGPVIREWRANEINLTANLVCAPCNNGWMSAVESTHAIPTLKDMVLSSNAVSLLPSGLKSIAIFTFLKAVVADHMNTARAPFFSRRQRRAFSESQEIPDGVQVWLSRFSDRGRRGNFSTYYGSLKETDYKGFDFFVFTYVANFVVLQLTAIRWPSLIDDPPLDPRGFPFPKFVQPQFFQVPIWNEACQQIWPIPKNTRAALWPSPRSVDSEALDALTFRWQRLETRPIASIVR